MTAQPATVHRYSAWSPAHPDVDRLLREIPQCRDVHKRQALENEVVTQLLDLAENVARRYRNRGIPTDDLVQVARLGLVKAVRRYRPEAGPNFAAFAELTMSGEVKRHFRDCGWAVRPPRRLQELRTAVAVESDRLAQQLRHQPALHEVAESLGVTARDVDDARRASSAFAFHPLEPPTGDPYSVNVADPFDAYEFLEHRDALRRALRKLTPRQQRIVTMRFVEERTQSEIGQAIGVSQMQVSRLLRAVLDTLRAEVEGDGQTTGSGPTSASELQVAG